MAAISEMKITTITAMPHLTSAGGMSPNRFLTFSDLSSMLSIALDF